MRTHTEESQSTMTPEKALQYLKEGNIRFQSNLKANRNLLQQVNETSEGQFPFAVVLSCIDSRVSTEILFDQGLGDVFSIRIAGNFVNEDILGSMEFACKIAGSKLVLVVGHTQTNQTGIDRAKGFIDQMKKYKGIKLLKTQYAEGGDALKAQEIISAALVANKDLKGVYATNEGISIGAGQAFKARKLKNGAVKLIGFDSGKQQMENIKSGLQTGAITQSPMGIGAKTVEALVNYVRDKKVPAPLIDTGFYYYDKSNIAEPQVAGNLYE